MSVFLHYEQGVPVILVMSYDPGFTGASVSEPPPCADHQLEDGFRFRSLLFEWLLPTVIRLETRGERARGTS